MGKPEKLIDAFIDSIPDDKLVGPWAPGTIFGDRNFRLDMQGITTKEKAFNLQVQVNEQTTITSFQAMAPDTCAGPVFCTEKKPKTPAGIRTELKAAKIKYKGPNIAKQPNRDMPPKREKKNKNKK